MHHVGLYAAFIQCLQNGSNGKPLGIPRWFISIVDLVLGSDYRIAAQHLTISTDTEFFPLLQCSMTYLWCLP